MRGEDRARCAVRFAGTALAPGAGVDRGGSLLSQRLLDVLEHLLQLPAGDLKATLSHVSDVIARASGADKVDAFLYDAPRDSLVAVGSSTQPLSMLQRQYGLDVLPLSNGGRAVQVFKSGETFLSGSADEDAEELPGLRHVLKVKSDQGVFHIQPQAIELGALVRDIVGAFGSAQHAIQVTVQQGDDIRVAGDPARLRQCLENVVANAIQKSPASAAIDIFVRREEREDRIRCAVVEVIDEGPGIPPGELPYLFERYRTGRAAQGGLGLGLYIAKRIAAVHGGDLTADSRPGKGARFTLTLPLER